ncbi:MAG: flagellar biosynthesis protein FlhF, partial [Clostridiales bacterium]|nr:flagellar biosynthesis protein FlhF [Clostridiales bacterium]
MRIKKFEAHTEQEAIKKVKNDLGLNALILSIRKVKPKGVFAIFKKTVVEVTAAYDDKPRAKPEESGGSQYAAALAEDAPTWTMPTEDFVPDEVAFKKQKAKIKSLEEKINVQEELLVKLTKQLSLSEHLTRKEQGKYDNRLIQVFYDTLIEQGVTPEIAENILEDVNEIEDESQIDINLISTIVYNKIVGILGPAEPIETFKTKRTRFIIFMGPTGVGKTTTIAKISSILMLYHNLKVGLMTADTYRIAAIEQLKTYADILGLSVDVIYNSQDVQNHLDPIVDQENDVVLIDT